MISPTRVLNIHLAYPMTLRPVSLLFALFLLISAVPAPAQPDPLADLDTYVIDAMAVWEVPGVAIAVVKDGAVVHAAGYGVRDLRTGEPVDANTVFAIGSATKAFTAAALGMLVQEGTLTWDTPAYEVLPSFEVYDPYVTRELTVRDLLTHRSGLERGDLLWYGSDYDRDEILRRVRYLEPSWSVRSQFGYQNIMYLAAGQILPAETDQSWDAFIQARFFQPLGMARSTTTVDGLDAMANVAQPHVPIEGTVTPVPYRDIDNVAPAGSINSSVTDMAAWVELHLAQGQHDSDQLLDTSIVRELHTPQTIIRKEGRWALFFPEAQFLTYGLGWFLFDHRGHKVVQHGGNIDGMHANVGMIPDEDLGVVVLTNTSPNFLAEALTYRIFDAYLGAPERDWSAEMLAIWEQIQAQGEAQQAEREAARVEGTMPSLDLSAYAGTYTHPMYGEATIAQEGGGLVARFGEAFVGDLAQWHYDTFEATWRDGQLGTGLVTFHLGADGTVDSVEIEGVATFERTDS